MSRFQFKLQTLLDIRRGNRDQYRQILAQVLSRDAELVEERKRLEQHRTDQLGELRQLNDAGELDVDASAARRFFAGQLTGSMANVDHQRGVVAEQLEMCRKALIEADRAVKALENLEEKQLSEFRYHEERRTQRELEDGWSATHSGEVPVC